MLDSNRIILEIHGFGFWLRELTRLLIGVCGAMMQLKATLEGFE